MVRRQATIPRQQYFRVSEPLSPVLYYVPSPIYYVVNSVERQFFVGDGCLQHRMRGLVHGHQ